MIAYLASAGVALSGVCLAMPLGRLAGVSRETPASADAAAPRDLGRLVAALGALALLVGGTDGDVMLAAILAAVVVAHRSPLAAVTLVTVAAVAALRVGSSVVADIGAAHALLGPAVTSPSFEVAGAAALAGLAGLGAAAAVVDSRTRRPVRAIVRDPAALADALGPVLAVLLATVAVAGPLVVSGAGGWWLIVRVAGLSIALTAAALFRRASARWPPDGLAGVAAGVALAALALAVGGR